MESDIGLFPCMATNQTPTPVKHRYSPEQNIGTDVISDVNKIVFRYEDSLCHDVRRQHLDEPLIQQKMEEMAEELCALISKSKF